MKVVILTSVFAILVVLGANMHPLWGDEVETGLFARNILRYGLPKGWDGINIMGINDAIVLNSDLINHTSPWAQYYLVAASFKVFGESAFSARLPFILFAILSIPLYCHVTMMVVKSHRVALLATTILATSVPFVLFAYQARYYSLVSFAGILFVLACHLLTKKSWAKILFIVSSVLLFYGNYAVFVAFFLATIVSVILTLWVKGDKRDKGIEIWLFLRTTTVLSIVTAILTAPWFIILKPLSGRGSLSPPPLGESISLLRQIIVDAFYPFNQNNAFPYALAALFICFLIHKIRKKEEVRAWIFALSLPLSYLLVMIGFTAVAEVDTAFVQIRYTMIVFPYFVLCSVLALEEVIKRNKLVGIGLISLFVTTNIFTIYPFRSFLWEYLGEIRNPYKTPDQLVADYLSHHAKDGDTAFVSLDRAHEPLIFDLKDKIRFVNRVTPRNPRIFPKNRSTLPRYISDFLENPDWVILYSKRGNDGTLLTFDYRPLSPRINLVRDYEEFALPVFFVDMSRPEIEFRSFKEIIPDANDRVFIYRKRKF